MSGGKTSNSSPIAWFLLPLALLSAGLYSCSHNPGPAPLVPQPSATTSIASAPPEPQKSIKRADLATIMKQAANKASVVYANEVPGKREAKAIEKIAQTVRNKSGCKVAGIPAFFSKTEAGNYLLYLAHSGVPLDAIEGKTVPITNKEVLKRAKELIESSYDVKVTLQSANVTVLVLVGGCNIK